MMDKREISLIIALFAGCFLALSGKQPSFVVPTSWNDMEPQALMSKGRDYLMVRNQVDSALACFTLAASSWDEAQTPEQRHTAISAMNNIGFVYFYHILDVPKAFATFNKAVTLAEESKEESLLPYLYMNLANVYSLYADQASQPALYDETINYYKKGFRAAVSQSDWEIIVMCFINMTDLGAYPQVLDRCREEIDMFASLPLPVNVPLAKFAKERLQALQSIRRKDYAAAERHYRNQLSHIDTQVTPEQYEAQTLSDLAMLFEMSNEHDSALIYLNRLISISENNDKVDCGTFAYRSLERIYKKIGDKDRAERARMKYYESRDSMMTQANLNSIEHIKYADRIEAVGQELSVARTERRNTFIVAALLSVLFIGAVVSIAVIINRHNRLKKSSASLFERYQQLLEREEENRLLQKRLSEVKPLHMSADAAVEKTEHEDGAGQPETARRGIDEETLSDMKMRLTGIFASSPEIFNPDFSLSQLSALSGVAARSLSAVLSEAFGKNFYALLNEYRVKEACRRICDTENYGNMTLEAISQSVGYKSRTSLASAFKKETGLTPSQYLKLAREKTRSLPDAADGA